MPKARDVHNLIQLENFYKVEPSLPSQAVRS